MRFMSLTHVQFWLRLADVVNEGFLKYLTALWYADIFLGHPFLGQRGTCS